MKSNFILILFLFLKKNFSYESILVVGSAINILS